VTIGVRPLLGGCLQPVLRYACDGGTVGIATSAGRGENGQGEHGQQALEFEHGSLPNRWREISASRIRGSPVSAIVLALRQWGAGPQRRPRRPCRTRPYKHGSGIRSCLGQVLHQPTGWVASANPRND
jgi:hypothetical protein